MKIHSLRLVYFSPTGTTKRVIQSIAEGVNIENVTHNDITKQEDRETPIEVKENELLIVAVPVYMGRVPDIVNKSLSSIKADKTPVVPVVVYGNRAYDNALLELKDIVENTRCITIAGAAFIGEHSFSSDEYPIAKSRPDSNDEEYAVNFGKQIKDKLNNTLSIEDTDDLIIPGTRPYGGVTELWSVDFIEISEKCTDNGICADICPTGAINPENIRQIDIEKCISCCACIKICPQNARTMKESKVKDATIRLNSNCSHRKEPETYI